LIAAVAALNGLLAVAVGAFGAHGIADPQAKAWIATGATYGLGHAVAALVVEPRSRAAAWAMTAGAFVFAGSLYLIALTGLRWLGMVAPVGGLLMIAGWALLLVAALKAR
jgi:uncharacterized membrane protein YgdD (TMEM256/DUF423 family)